LFNHNENNREREISGLKEAMDKFNLKTGLLLTDNQEEEIRFDNRVIKLIPVWKWLLE